MRHRHHQHHLGRNRSHRRCLIANAMKALISHRRIETTLSKAKVLRQHADRCITWAKKETLAGRRRLIADLMVRFNPLTPKEARAARKSGDTSSYNDDRLLFQHLEGLVKDFKDRQGGYTRIVRIKKRRGDGAETCILEYLPVEESKEKPAS